MKRALALAFLLVLAAAPVAAASNGPARVRVGEIAVGPAVAGHSTVFVAVAYPIALLGHRAGIEVLVAPGPRSPHLTTTDLVLLSGGSQRTPERRRRFTFVHGLELTGQQTRAVGAGAKVTVRARAVLDANRDGKPELASDDSGSTSLRPGRGAAAGRRLCATMPLLRARPGQRLAVGLPACTAPRHWRIVRQPRHGGARLRGGELIYTPAAGFRGSDALRLSGGATVTIKVGAAQEVSVRAMGDSVTAGFGYYDTGKPMSLLELPECKPGSVTLVNPCSSNSRTLNNSAAKVEYAPDYGLANNVSWAAQWSNEHGITNYENLAISGSEPGQWAPGGPLYATTRQIESEDPDYILMTVGANPLLSETLFGVDQMGCAIYSDIFGGYSECIEAAFAKIGLHENLEALYRELVQKTGATIYLMQYHLSVPASAIAYTAVQIAEMAKMMNEEIAAVAAAVNPKRLQVVAPPHFNVGVDLSPVYPSQYSCSRLGYKVDGPSVQTDASQDELLLDHPLSFCSGPVSGPPWVISGDTGIHPSAAGYAQMASQVPAPG